ncbi:7-cyano-7-deazaguanine reductase, partial [Vibrio campbellii CAIM 519 = NBRC 15631 = ATCC 25920]
MTTYDKNLGKRSEYISEYQPELLDPIPRKIGRDEIKDLKVANYAGYDLWTAFEVSWLNNKGKPIVAIAEFMVPHTSDN